LLAVKTELEYYYMNKRRWKATALSLLLLPASILPQSVRKSEELEDPPWIKELARKRVVYSIPSMKRVKARKNLIYKRTEDTTLKMDVYGPATSRASEGRPAVIFIHGGRIPPNLRTTPKDWGAYVSFGELVAASGFVGITFNHRFYSWNSLSDSQSDVIDLISYVRNHARSLGVDKDRIVLWAVSAGGIFLSQPLRDAPPYLSCLIGYYAELDLQNERASAPPEVSNETLREYSPIYHLERGTAKIPPMFIARAGLDDANLNDGLDRFVQAALRKNMTVDFANHATGHHGFDVEDDNTRSREIIKRTIEFIKTHTQ
jgi:acetyl esterase/lipase